MVDITDGAWSQTDDNNDSASPDGFPEGMSPGSLNNASRMVMGAVKRAYVWSNVPTTTTGTSTAYLLSYDVAPEALVNGMAHVVTFHTTCGASPTLNINSLGAHALHYYDGTDWAVVPAGTIVEDMACTLSYNSNSGTYRIRTFPSAVGTATLGGDNAFTGVNTFGDAINEAHGADIASAATINLTTATGNLIDVTGTTTVTAITLAEGYGRVVRTTGILIWTHGASLVLPTATNITSAAGDFWVFRGYAAGVVRMVGYMRASGKALVTSYTAPQRAYAYVTIAAGVATLAKQSGFTSVTRTAAGKFTCTLSSAMADTNYRVLAMARADGTAGEGQYTFEISTAGRTTTVFYLAVATDNIGFIDPSAINIEVFA